MLGVRNRPRAPGRAADTRLAGDVKALLAEGESEAACAQFDLLVNRYQPRAARIAYYYLHDPADVDEAVQDAFLKAFVHLPSFREDLCFEFWFTRILVNGCLDRLKTRTRRRRWVTPVGDDERERAERQIAAEPSPEALLLQRERRDCLAAAVQRLPTRQRTVVILGQLAGYATRDVARTMGVSEATVRVHLFQAVRSLRKALGGQRWLLEGRATPSSPAVETGTR